MNPLANNMQTPIVSLAGKEEESHIQRLFELSFNPLCIVGFDGYFKIINPAFSKLLGYSKAEILSQTCIQWVHPEDKETTLEMVNILKSQEKDLRGFKNRYRKKNGDYVHFEWNITVDPQNERAYCTLNDISQQILEQEEKAKLLENFNLILEGSNAGIWSHDLRSGEEWWSDKFYEILAYKPDDIQASFKNFLSLVHPGDRDCVHKNLVAHHHYQTNYKIEIRLLCKDGTYKWVETSAQSIWDTQGKALRMTGTIVDIDRRKKAQLEIEYHDFLLNQAAKMAKVGGWELCFETLTVSWSEEVYRIHEVDKSFKPNLEAVINFYCEESKPIIKKALEKASKQGINYDLELRIKTANERKVWVRAIGQPIFDTYQNIIGIHGILQEIDEQKKRELSLNKSLEIISEQNKRLSNFAYIVSHNLRSHISNFQLLLELKDHTAEQIELEKIQQMERTTFYRLRETIEHLTEVVEIQTEISLQKVPINFNTALEKTLDVLGMDISRTRAEIKADFQELTHVNYVQLYLESILLNLISNSIKYRHPNRSPFIQIKSFREQNYGVLSIQDNGLGIDLATHRDKIFGMFNTFHEHPQAKGIGLFITKNQVEALGGYIEVESELGKGTCFKVYLTKLSEAE